MCSGLPVLASSTSITRGKRISGTRKENGRSIRCASTWRPSGDTALEVYRAGAPIRRVAPPMSTRASCEVR